MSCPLRKKRCPSTRTAPMLSSLRASIVSTILWRYLLITDGIISYSSQIRNTLCHLDVFHYAIWTTLAMPFGYNPLEPNLLVYTAYAFIAHGSRLAQTAARANPKRFIDYLQHFITARRRDQQTKQDRAVSPAEQTRTGDRQ